MPLQSKRSRMKLKTSKAMSLHLVTAAVLLLVAVAPINGQPTPCVSSCVGKDTSDGQRFPHCSDCKSYVFCDVGGLINRTCPANLYFNAMENNCDLKNVSVCGATTSSSSSQTTTTSTTASTTTTAPLCYNQCMSSMFGTNLRYPVCGSCMHYLECVGGNSNITQCPSNLFYNHVAQDCDRPANVVCTWGTTTATTTTTVTTTTTTTTTTGTTTTTSSTSASTTTAALTEAPAGVCLLSCTNVAISNRRYPHCSECTKYVQCLSSGFMETTCPSGLHHDDDIQDCNFPADTTCYTTTTSSPTTTQPSSRPCVSSCAGKTDGDYPSCTTCYGFVSCAGGIKYDMPCAASLVWDDSVRMCQETSTTCSID